MGVTSSEFQQSVTYKRALEGELASTISALDGVKTASVRLAIPEETVFVATDPEPTASVFVETTPGVDARRRQGAGDRPPDLRRHRRPQARERRRRRLARATSCPPSASAPQVGVQQATDYEQRIADAVQAILDRVVGPGNATVAVAADVTGESAQRRARPSPTPTAPRRCSESSKTEKYTGTGGGAAGVLGPDNIAVPGGTSGNGTFDSATETKNNAVNKVTENRMIPAGAVNRQTVSVAVDQAAAGGLNLASADRAGHRRGRRRRRPGRRRDRGGRAVQHRRRGPAAAALEARQAAAGKPQKQAAFFGTLVIAGSILLGLLILALVVAPGAAARRQNREPVDLGERLDLEILPVMPPVTALPPAPATSAIPIVPCRPMVPPPAQLEAERRRFEIDDWSPPTRRRWPTTCAASWTTGSRYETRRSDPHRHPEGRRRPHADEPGQRRRR